MTSEEATEAAKALDDALKVADAAHAAAYKAAYEDAATAMLATLDADAYKAARATVNVNLSLE